MNKFIRHLILQKVREYVKKRKEGKLKKFNLMKTFEKFLRGGAAGLVGAAIALYTGKDPAIPVPIIVGLFEAIYNVIKFFLTQKEDK